MEKYIVKSIFALLGLFAIYFIYSAIIGAIGGIFDDGDIINCLIAFVIALGLLTWIFSKLLAFICYNNSFVYWAFTFGLAVYILVLGLNGELTGPNAFSACFSHHFILLFFLIPKLDGTTDYYLNREVTYDGYNASYREWVSESYTPGWVSKVIAQAVIAAIAAAIYSESGDLSCMWFVFAVEGGWSGYLTLVNFRYTFF
jgi:hypothetical protein